MPNRQRGKGSGELVWIAGDMSRAEAPIGSGNLEVMQVGDTSGIDVILSIEPVIDSFFACQPTGRASIWLLNEQRRELTKCMPYDSTYALRARNLAQCC